MPVLAKDDLRGGLADDLEDLGGVGVALGHVVRLAARSVHLGQLLREAHVVVDAHVRRLV